MVKDGRLHATKAYDNILVDNRWKIFNEFTLENYHKFQMCATCTDTFIWCLTLMPYSMLSCWLFGQIRNKFGHQVEAFYIILTAIQFHLLFYATRPLPNILALCAGYFSKLFSSSFVHSSRLSLQSMKNFLCVAISSWLCWTIFYHYSPSAVALIN